MSMRCNEIGVYKLAPVAAASARESLYALEPSLVTAALSREIVTARLVANLELFSAFRCQIQSISQSTLTDELLTRSESGRRGPQTPSWLR